MTALNVSCLSIHRSRKAAKFQSRSCSGIGNLVRFEGISRLALMTTIGARWRHSSVRSIRLRKLGDCDCVSRRDAPLAPGFYHKINGQMATTQFSSSFCMARQLFVHQPRQVAHARPPRGAWGRRRAKHDHIALGPSMGQSLAFQLHCARRCIHPDKALWGVGRDSGGDRGDVLAGTAPAATLSFGRRICMRVRCVPEERRAGERTRR